MNLLKKARILNEMVQNASGKTVNFMGLAENLRDVINANIYIIDKEGYVPGFAVTQEIENKLLKNILVERYFPKEYTDGLLKLNKTTSNIDIKSDYTIFPIVNKERLKNGFATVVPIVCGGQRFGSLVISRIGHQFESDDLILAEYSSTVVGMEFLYERSEAREEKTRNKANIQMALGTLSFSELEAIEKVIEELDGIEGMIVSYKIAEQIGVSRSIIVNAIKKLQSASIIESRSLGMKGTYIKLLNNDIIAELGVLV